MLSYARYDFSYAARRLLPESIAAGCDMFLFFNNIDEDYGFMMNGYKNGVITEERLQDALERILGMKASIGLHKTKRRYISTTQEDLKVVGCEDHIDALRSS